MRNLILILLAASLAFTGCNRNKNDDALEALTQSEQAEQSLDQEEIFARDKIVELTDLIQQSVKEGSQVDADVEKWLQDNRQALTQNARALEEKLQSKEGEERAYYEETFSVFMRPTLDAWNHTLNDLSQSDKRAYTRIQSLLKTTMNRK